MLSSSPLTSPAGRDGHRVIPATPGSGWKDPIDLDDEDSDDRLSPYFTQPTQINKRKTLAPANDKSSSKLAPGATQPTQIVDRRTIGPSKIRYSQAGTQPTQIVDRPILNGAKAGDPGSEFSTPSPRVAIEVPRSSPFKSSPPQQAPHRANIFKLMGPAGTTFRPPQAKIRDTITGFDKNGTKPTATRIDSVEFRKRSLSSDSLDELHQSPNFEQSDSSGDERMARGAIKPSSFQRNLPSTGKMADLGSAQRLAEFTEKYTPMIQLQAKRLQKRVGGHHDLLLCARVLESKNADVDAAEKFLKNFTPSKKIASPFSNSSKRSSASRHTSPSPAPKRRRLVRGSELKSGSSSPNVSTELSSPDCTPSPAPQPRGRRLVRGGDLKGRSGPAPVVSLIDDSDIEEVSNDKDDGDNYASDSEMESEIDGGESDAETASTKTPQTITDQLPIGANRTAKILRYLETCTVEGLAANAKISKEAATSIIKKRPIRTISLLRAIHTFRTVRKTKQKVDLGEEVFYELNQYFKRLEAIDRIVHQCETQGGIIKAKLDQWEMDHLGNLKDTKSGRTNCVLPFPDEPQHMKGYCKMSPYQLYGMNWLFQLYSRGSGGILADDMGLGKTCQTIAFISLLVDIYRSGQVKDKPWPNLVVVPPSVLANWENEFAQFAPGLSVIKYSGNPIQRDILGEQLRASPEDYHVVLTSYSQMSRPKDANWMTKMGVNVAIFDEAHRLKNPNTSAYKELIRIEARWKLFITGTPIQNNIMELISLLNFISPRLFKRDRELIEELFSQKTSLQEVSEGAALHSDRIQRARGILEPFILLRKKEVVLKSLPTKTRRVVYCDMTENQKKLYQELVSKFRKSKKEEPKAKQPVTKAPVSGRKNDENNPWVQLRKAASHSQQFRRFFDNKRCESMAKTLMENVSQKELRQPSLHYLTEELKALSDFELHIWCKEYSCLRSFDCPDGAWLDSGKVEKLVELLKDYRKNGDRVLVFSRFKLVIDILGECMAGAGINCRVLHGTTQVADRQVIVDEFNNDTSIEAFLLTTMTGGQGLNLTSANKVVIFDQSDNPQHDVQAENRVHRLGQTKEVEIVRLLTRNTIDELIYKACQKKLELAGQITGFSEELGEEMEKDMVAEVTKMILKGEGGGVAE